MKFISAIASLLLVGAPSFASESIYLECYPDILKTFSIKIKDRYKLDIKGQRYKALGELNRWNHGKLKGDVLSFFISSDEFQDEFSSDKDDKLDTWIYFTISPPYSVKGKMVSVSHGEEPQLTEWEGDCKVIENFDAD